jgi:putative ABC transport system permease protein
MVYVVARRTQEIGLRVAMGAANRDIARMLLVDCGRMIGAGSAVGLAISLLITRPLTMFLVPGLRPADPVTYLAVAALLACMGAIATWGPARRALAIDPAKSLRYE